MSIDPRTHAMLRLAERVAQTLEQAGITPEDPDYFELLANETDLERVLIRLARVALARESEAEGVKLYMEKLKERKERKENAAKRLREEIFFVMSELGIKSIPSPDVTISLQNGRPKLVGDADVETLPEDLIKVKKEPDRTKIKAAIEAGQEVEGYQISNGTPFLTLRTA